MGFNYGQRRNRLHDLNVSDGVLGYALNDKLEFEKYDIQQIADIVNKKLDKASEDLKNRFT